MTNASLTSRVFWLPRRAVVQDELLKEKAQPHRRPLWPRHLWVMSMKVRMMMVAARMAKLVVHLVSELMMMAMRLSMGL
jgi:hypothetical protein